MDDVKIVSLYLQRDESAIGETEKKYGAYLRRISMNILDNASDSEENVNDTYLNVEQHSAASARPARAVYRKDCTEPCSEPL